MRKLMEISTSGVRPKLPELFLRGKGSDGLITPSERQLLRIARQTPGISRSEMTARTDLTQQSVYRLMETLRDDGLVLFGDPKPGAGKGQPSPTIHLNPAYAYTAGVSVNTDAISVCLFDFAGALCSTELLNIVGAPRAIGLEKIRTSIARQIDKTGLPRQRLLAVGFAIAGFLHEGTTYNTPLPLHEWSLIELGPLIADLTGRPVWTGNSANTAAICETMLGVGRHISDFAYLSFNYGFGGAAVIGGELLRGGHGNAGELSAMFGDADRDRRPALEHLMRRLQRHGVDIPSVEYIRLNYDPAWPGVREWIDQVTPALNQAVNAIFAILDPQAIVFGGQIPKRLAAELIRRVAFSGQPRHGRRAKEPKLFVSELKEDASSVGAAATPFKDLFF